MEKSKKVILPLLAFIVGFAFAYLLLNKQRETVAQEEFNVVESVIDQQIENAEIPNEEKEEEIISDEKILAQSVATSTNENNFDYIKVSDQKAGKEVEVAYVKAEQPVWIVVHMEKDGKIWNALGARRKEAGEYTGVVVPLLAPTTKGARYWAVLYADNGDKEFSLDKDFPLKNADGEFIMVDFKAI